MACGPRLEIGEGMAEKKKTGVMICNQSEMKETYLLNIRGSYDVVGCYSM